MSRWRLLWRTVRFFWRSDLAVAAGVAVAAAVITGALLLGDSLRGSLRRMSLDRLGPVDAVLRTDRFFRQALREELQTRLANHPRREQIGLIGFVPIILLEGMVTTAEGQPSKTLGGVQIIGCDERFWNLEAQRVQEPSEQMVCQGGGLRSAGSGVAGSATSALAHLSISVPEESGVLVNQPLADQLGLRPGQEILIRFPRWQNIAPESALGRKEGTVRSWRLRVAGLLPENRWPGRFALANFQQKPLLVYVPLKALQERLAQPERINAILAIGPSGRLTPPEPQEAVLTECLRPSAEDYGVRVEQIGQGKYTYIHITSDRLLFPPALEEAVRRALVGQRFQPVLTYLANTIQLTPPKNPPITHQPPDGRILPYSTVTAIDFQAEEPLGPFRSVEGRVLPPLQDSPEPEIVLNAWAAQSLGLPLPQPSPDIKIHQALPPNHKSLRSSASSELTSTSPEKADLAPAPAYLYVTFFEPETIEGQTVERTERFRLAGIVGMDGPARDRHLTPEVPGLTDRRSIADWDVPFQPFYEGLIRPADEGYFRQEGLTPKAFVSLATGWRLWASRFGRISSFRVAPSSTATVEQLRRRIQEAAEPAKLGFVFQPVKRRALAASEGAGSFEMLFLGFSGFLILSAGMLVVLLFRLGVQRRQEQLGLLLALGFCSGQIHRLLLAEGMLAALAGSALGAVMGWAYGAMVLAGFRAVAGSNMNIWFLRLEARPASFLIGFLAGILLGAATIAWAVRRSAKASPRRLLSGLSFEEPESPAPSAGPAKRPRLIRWAIGAFIGAAVTLGLLGWTGLRNEEMAQAGAFFAAGLLMLTAGLLWIRQLCHPTETDVPETAFTGRLVLVRLAIRTASRNPRRTSLTVGLMAAAVFLITATSVFRVQLPASGGRLDDGAGGLSLWVETTMPIFYDLGQPEGRNRLATWTDTNEQIFQNAQVQVFSLRVRSGDDASCRNLYRPGQPRILGLPDGFLQRSAFAWSQTLAQTAEEEANPWLLLHRPVETQADGAWVVPAIADADTATYSLKVGLGQDVEIRTDQGIPIRFRIVGLLRHSMFQGDLLIWEKHFVRLFPEEQGYRLFLVAVPLDRVAQQAEVEQLWQQALAEYGLRLQRCQERLAGFLAVQNSYLATFQSLGGLGLVLGTLGLGVVQMRNVLERRRELALLAAVGFPPARLGWLILWETWLLLGWGLGCGLVAAAVAVWPHWLSGQGSLPWTLLAGGLALVFSAGTLAGLAAVRTALRLPILQLLRTE